jgi:hypothetical protein
MRFFMETGLIILVRPGLAAVFQRRGSIKRPCDAEKKSLDVAPKAVNLRPLGGIKAV